MRHERIDFDPRIASRRQAIDRVVLRAGQLTLREVQREVSAYRYPKSIFEDALRSLVLDGRVCIMPGYRCDSKIVVALPN